MGLDPSTGPFFCLPPIWPTRSDLTGGGGWSRDCTSCCSCSPALAPAAAPLGAAPLAAAAAAGAAGGPCDDEAMVLSP
eukprot:1150802-Pelagomonas_calceolata.AAC.2